MEESETVAEATSQVPNRFARTAAGIAAIAVLILAFCWMILHFIAQPESASLKVPTPRGMASGFAPHVAIEEVEEVPYGETAVLDDLTAGAKYDFDTSPSLQEQWEAMSEDGKRAYTEDEGWDYEVAPFSARVVGCSMVSEEAFTEWYPLYFQTNQSEELYAEEDVRVVVVDVELANLSTEPLVPPVPVLRGSAFASPQDMLDGGLLPDSYAQAALYPSDAGDGVVALQGEYASLMPGEARIVRYPFLVYRNSFSAEDGIDTADLSDMEIAYLDYDPFRVVALKLANAHDAARVGVRNAYVDAIVSGELSEDVPVS